MKSLLALSILSLVGCTTYKVDEKGICRAPNGKIVNEADVDLSRWMKGVGYGRYAPRHSALVSPGCWWAQSSTAYGW